MAADERLPCRVHRRRIERLRIVPRVVAIEHRRRAAVVNLIAIALADRVVRGVKAVGRVFDRDDGDVVGQHRVEAAVQIVVRQPRLGRDADDLAERVDAGVGAAGGGDAHRLLRDLLPGALRASPCTVGLSG